MYGKKNLIIQWNSLPSDFERDQEIFQEIIDSMLGWSLIKSFGPGIDPEKWSKFRIFETNCRMDWEIIVGKVMKISNSRIEIGEILKISTRELEN